MISVLLAAILLGLIAALVPLLSAPTEPGREPEPPEFELDWRWP